MILQNIPVKNGVRSCNLMFILIRTSIIFYSNSLVYFWDINPVWFYTKWVKPGELCVTTVQPGEDFGDQWVTDTGVFVYNIAYEILSPYSLMN